jgi:hypothetical protein
LFTDLAFNFLFREYVDNIAQTGKKFEEGRNINGLSDEKIAKKEQQFV